MLRRTKHSLLAQMSLFVSENTILGQQLAHVRIKVCSWAEEVKCLALIAAHIHIRHTLHSLMVSLVDGPSSPRTLPDSSVTSSS